MTSDEFHRILREAGNNESGAGFGVSLLLRSGVIVEITPFLVTNTSVRFTNGSVSLEAIDAAWVNWAPGADCIRPCPADREIIEEPSE